MHNGDKSSSWEVGVISGPHADPDFITSAFMETFHSSPYKVSPCPSPGAHNRAHSQHAGTWKHGHPLILIHLQQPTMSNEASSRSPLLTPLMCAWLAPTSQVHYQSNRLGVRLVGPKPEWVRPDGGEGGTHPSNVHDHIYALGAINFTGDHPVVLTVDGPSLGGFVCPATITSTELWKIGQVGADCRLTACFQPPHGT